MLMCSCDSPAWSGWEVTSPTPSPGYYWPCPSLYWDFWLTLVECYVCFRLRWHMLQQTAWCPSPTCPSRNGVWGEIWFCSPRGGIQSLKKNNVDVQAGEVGGLSQVNHSRTNSCGDIAVAGGTWAKINDQFPGLFGLSPPNPTYTPKTTGGQALWLHRTGSEKVSRVTILKILAHWLASQAYNPWSECVQAGALKERARN